MSDDAKPTPPAEQSPKPERTRVLGIGVLMPGDETTVTLQKQLPAGFAPHVINVKRSKARLVIVEVHPLTVTIANEGTEAASFMLFGISDRTQRVMGAVEAVARAVIPGLASLVNRNKEPTP